ncbi:hypothetical protein CYFUS_004774 [Cystobacter fuscus]|uniref:GH26 domain-containing protein n=1 Tax=Cystobacter fuscus TaxID=43 RepID=A0A250J722_9BACT|nr:glycosyl hydrolase [Cystobacter fuscus]ATB39330.1 hypothetical protein CYFUS_004774 [Cystobacter fuscus]
MNLSATLSPLFTRKRFPRLMTAAAVLALSAACGGPLEETASLDDAPGTLEGTLAGALTSRTGTVYIRFAHEMNGNWYPWKVTSSDATSFITAWKRYRALQKEIFPAAKLVFNVNRESVSSGIDWRKTFPGAAYVDVMGVDYYNQYPYVATVTDWNNAIQQTDGYGAPKGLARHLEFARSVGLPLSISEWSGNADNGDSPLFIEQMHNFFKVNGGTGAGKVLYEVLFNVDRDNRRWILNPNTRMPNSAARYVQLF